SLVQYAPSYYAHRNLIMYWKTKNAVAVFVYVLYLRPKLYPLFLMYQLHEMSYHLGFLLVLVQYIISHCYFADNYSESASIFIPFILNSLINCNFSSLVNRFNAYSRLMAVSFVANSSVYTSSNGPRPRVYFAPFPDWCL